ncbi:MAG: molybdopterin-dependent oxidoreductase [Nanoarchaeota archaeon]|nr:molybdopterin-dependent oxidoreductase [Nanoarchaeota archaeon]MBU4351501.1 molybdopterin-dependent oxidoreductase [Nanoarchaeota archaeon]MBU4456490.1 molybdopterin-dependent oxidoreductase [Nanoarchaeota archaeon]
MEKRADKSILIIIIVLCVIVLALVISFLNKEESDTLKELQAVEIQNYEGKDLSSVGDFRENSIKGPQYLDKKDYRLQVTGLVEEEKEYTFDDLIKREHFKKVVTLNCVEGWSATILWEGFLLRDLLAEAKLLDNAKFVIFHAEDGYTTAYPIEYFTEHDIIVADKMNGYDLLPERGFPLQLVAETKWGYKWIKWITKIELSDDENYRGFWESRGYSNSGELDESFRE